MAGSPDADAAPRRPPSFPIGRLLFASIPLLLVVALHYYVGTRLITQAGITGFSAVLGWLVLGGFLLSVFLGLGFARSAQRSLAVISAWISHLWIGAFAFLIVTLPVLDLLRVFGTAVWPTAFADRLTVGQLEAALAVALVTLAVLLGVVSARGKPHVEKVRVPIVALPPELEGYRIVQVSDIHIGQTLGRAFLQRMVNQVNALKPDAIAVTGDLIDGHVDALRDEVAPLADLKATDGAFFVTGNHEYYYDGFGWEDAVRKMGLTVLHNSHHVVR
ncbi:MAG: metallophosphoesterase, partial [Myxococcaceae bacterium]